MGRQGTQGGVHGIPCHGCLGDQPRVSRAPAALWLLLAFTRAQHGHCSRGVDSSAGGEVGAPGAMGPLRL